ncbi:MAG: hypothetical protein LBK25_06120 [Treponema sp.]|nr:hypothetical protein [Treponema sp.]
MGWAGGVRHAAVSGRGCQRRVVIWADGVRHAAVSGRGCQRRVVIVAGGVRGAGVSTLGGRAAEDCRRRSGDRGARHKGDYVPITFRERRAPLLLMMPALRWRALFSNNE